MGIVQAALAPQTLYVTVRRDELRTLKEERARLQHQLAHMTRVLQQARAAGFGREIDTTL